MGMNLFQIRIPSQLFDLIVSKAKECKIFASRGRVEAVAEAITRTWAESNTGLEWLDFEENK